LSFISDVTTVLGVAKMESCYTKLQNEYIAMQHDDDFLLILHCGNSDVNRGVESNFNK